MKDRQRPEASLALNTAGAMLVDLGAASVDPASSLFDRVEVIIEQGQAFIVSQANTGNVVTFWRVGREIDQDILREQRADYGRQIVATLSRQLVTARGRSYEEKNLRRMIQFAQLYPDEQIVVTLSRQLSWSHFLALLPVKSEDARAYYAAQAVQGRLGVRDLRGIIERKAYERREISNAQAVAGSAVPLDAFRDPYLLDFLRLADGFHERDLESAIIYDMQAFLLEVGNGWAFVDRQKRIILDGDDLYLDLLFYSRPLRRLIAVELKVGKFKAAYEGQMKLYLKWLDKYERHEGEEAPIGLILCTEASRERVELLEMHKDGIVVAEYWTTLPPKKELEERLELIMRQAKERLARRQILADKEAEGQS